MKLKLKRQLLLLPLGSGTQSEPDRGKNVYQANKVDLVVVGGEK